MEPYDNLVKFLCLSTLAVMIGFGSELRKALKTMRLELLNDEQAPPGLHGSKPSDSRSVVSVANDLLSWCRC